MQKPFSIHSLKKIISIVVVLVGLCVSLYQNFHTITSSNEQKNSENTSPLAEGFYKVIDVVDGDTIKIASGTESITLRLIGINTPEVASPYTKIQCFGPEASSRAKELLTNRSVRLEYDPTQNPLDKYGRTLAYIYRDDGLFYNQIIIEEGYAYEYTYQHHAYAHQKEFKQAQKIAMEDKKGLWASDTCNGKK